MSITLLIVLSALATYVWRAGGVIIGARLPVQSALFHWLSCVAFALLAGLMSRVLVFPAGVLAETSLSARLAAMVVGFSIFLLLGRRVVLATLAAATVFGMLIYTGF